MMTTQPFQIELHSLGAVGTVRTLPSSGTVEATVDIERQLLLVLALVLLNAAFSGSEIALLTLRDTQVKRLAQRSRAGRVVARLADDPNAFLATIQVGITLAGFLASATAAVTLSEPLVEPLGFLGGAARPMSIVVVTAVLTFVTLVVGELAPKRIALQRAERWALLAARPLAGIATAAKPVVWLLGRSTDLVVRLFGVDPSASRDEMTEEELRDVLTTHEAYSADERRIISGALEVADRRVRQVLRPRNEVLAIREDVDAASTVAALVAGGHTRAPVYRATLDDADRTVTLLDLLPEARGTARDHAQPAVAVPESAGVLDVLRTLQQRRQTMALVVSEYGGVEGIVTVEDLVEELVGEIHDETDRDVRRVVRRDDGTLEVPGDFPVHDLVDLGVEVPSGEYVTVAGLLMDALGRVPVEGDAVQQDGWELRVRSMHGRAVGSVLLARPRGDDGLEHDLDGRIDAHGDAAGAGAADSDADREPVPPPAER